MFGVNVLCWVPKIFKPVYGFWSKTWDSNYVSAWMIFIGHNSFEKAVMYCIGERVDSNLGGKLNGLKWSMTSARRFGNLD